RHRPRMGLGGRADTHPGVRAGREAAPGDRGQEPPLFPPLAPTKRHLPLRLPPPRAGPERRRGAAVRPAGRPEGSRDRPPPRPGHPHLRAEGPGEMTPRPLPALLAVALAFGCAAPALGQANAVVPDPDPELERRALQVAEGFEISLFAADPLLAK